MTDDTDAVLTAITASHVAHLQNDIVAAFNDGDADRSLFGACLGFVIRTQMVAGIGNRHAITDGINSQLAGIGMVLIDKHDGGHA